MGSGCCGGFVKGGCGWVVVEGWLWKSGCRKLRGWEGGGGEGGFYGWCWGVWDGVLGILPHYFGLEAWVGVERMGIPLKVSGLGKGEVPGSDICS